MNTIDAYLLQATRDEDAYTVSNQSDLLDTMDEVDNTLSLLLGGIAAISLLGGLLGLAASAAVVAGYGLFSGSAASLDWTTALAAVLFCAVIGVAFGGYPAAKASRLQPIEALHTL